VNLAGKDYLTVPEAAEYAGISVSHWRARVQRVFPPGRFCGKLIYRRVDVQRFVEANTLWPHPESTDAARPSLRRHSEARSSDSPLGRSLSKLDATRKAAPLLDPAWGSKPKRGEPSREKEESSRERAADSLQDERFSDDEKRRIVRESRGASVHAIARRYGVPVSQLYAWRRSFGGSEG
jgi:hypothetical protein